MRHLVLALTALVVLAMLPATADAACTSSTPSTASYVDSPADGDAGLAPEIVAVAAATSPGCGVGVQAVLADATSPGELVEGDAVGIYLDTDGNPATGSPLWEGARGQSCASGSTGRLTAPRRVYEAAKALAGPGSRGPGGQGPIALCIALRPMRPMSESPPA
jgi:hypothetical protein